MLAGIGERHRLLTALTTRHRIRARLDGLFDVTPRVLTRRAVRIVFGASPGGLSGWFSGLVAMIGSSQIWGGWAVPGSPGPTPGAGWSMSGPGGTISGGGVSGWAGWVGCGLSGGAGLPFSLSVNGAVFPAGRA